VQPGSSLAHHGQHGLVAASSAQLIPSGAEAGAAGVLPLESPSPPLLEAVEAPPVQLYRSFVEPPAAPAGAAAAPPEDGPAVSPPDPHSAPAGLSKPARRWRGANESVHVVDAGDSLKTRVRWTPVLRGQFDAAVAQLGGLLQAQPAQILNLMRAAHPEGPVAEPGAAVDDAPILASQMKLSHVKSHLQKCRLSLIVPGGVPRRPYARGNDPPASRPCEGGGPGIWHLLAAVAPEKARLDALDAAPAEAAEQGAVELEEEPAPGDEAAPNKRARVSRLPSRMGDYTTLL